MCKWKYGVRAFKSLSTTVHNLLWDCTHSVPCNRPSFGTTRRWPRGNWAPKSADRWKAKRPRTRRRRWPEPPPGPKCPSGTRPRPRAWGRVPRPSCGAPRSPRRASTAWPRRPRHRLQTICVESILTGQIDFKMSILLSSRTVVKCLARIGFPEKIK